MTNRGEGDHPEELTVPPGSNKTINKLRGTEQLLAARKGEFSIEPRLEKMERNK